METSKHAASASRCQVNSLPKNLSSLNLYKYIDHIAIAVDNLERALPFYRDMLGLRFVETREVEGDHSGMLSAVLSGGRFTVVLLQGTTSDSQVCRFINKYGMGVQHVAFAVDNIESAVTALKNNGIEFATTVINGNGLRQIFSKRDKSSGMMFEIIERTGEEGFQDKNVQSLFDQLESNNEF